MNLNEYQNYRETKSHTTAEFPYNTYLCSIPKDFPQVPLHWHAELELIVIKKGRGIVSVDLEKRSVTSGDIILIRPGQLHSIEQPIRAGQWDEMARLCAATPFPIALDEELIGINRRDRKIELLETIRPQYIILKPSLHGGISGSEEWMELAAERGIGSWVTSALESNIGLNAIAQWCATLQPALPQGLGTGLLFTDNIDYPLHIEGDCLWFHPEEQEPDLLNWLKQ